MFKMEQFRPYTLPRRSCRARLKGAIMANRNWNRAQNLEKEVKSLFVDVAIGASGAPTLTRGTGVASITRQSAGVYRITLQDAYIRLMHVDVKQLVAAAQDLVPQLVSESVSSSKQIDFRMVDSLAAEVDPASGSRLLIRIDLKNTSVI